MVQDVCCQNNKKREQGKSSSDRINNLKNIHRQLDNEIFTETHNADIKCIPNCKPMKTAPTSVQASYKQSRITSKYEYINRLKRDMQENDSCSKYKQMYPSSASDRMWKLKNNIKHDCKC